MCRQPPAAAAVVAGGADGSEAKGGGGGPTVTAASGAPAAETNGGTGGDGGVGAGAGAGGAPRGSSGPVLERTSSSSAHATPTLSCLPTPSSRPTSSPSRLTTPLRMALRFASRNSLLYTPDGVNIENLPGTLSDRRSPLGEMNWIFTANTDSIAWCASARTRLAEMRGAKHARDAKIPEHADGPQIHRTEARLPLVASTARAAPTRPCDPATLRPCDPATLRPCDPRSPNAPPVATSSRVFSPSSHDSPFLLPALFSCAFDHRRDMLPRDLFRRLFRQDLLLASLFRNFLIAQRIMARAGLYPVSSPPLPPMHQHPLWESFDLVAEAAICEEYSRRERGGGPPTPSPFFSDQLTAFEVWLRLGSKGAQRPPEQLPILLQVLLSPTHRLRALLLLGRFVALGAWAVGEMLSVGIFPYILKLLLSAAPELRPPLLYIWARVLLHDPSCSNDLQRDSAHAFFTDVLRPPPPPPPPGPSSSPPATPQTGPQTSTRPHSAQAAGGSAGGSAGRPPPPPPPPPLVHRTLALFVLAVICHGRSEIRTACLRNQLPLLIVQQLDLVLGLSQGASGENGNASTATSSEGGAKPSNGGAAGGSGGGGAAGRQRSTSAAAHVEAATTRAAFHPIGGGDPELAAISAISASAAPAGAASAAAPAACAAPAAVAAAGTADAQQPTASPPVAASSSPLSNATSAASPPPVPSASAAAAAAAATASAAGQAATAARAQHILWCCLCASQLCNGYEAAQAACAELELHQRLLLVLEEERPELRVAALYALAALNSLPQEEAECGVGSASGGGGRGGGGLAIGAPPASALANGPVEPSEAWRLESGGVAAALALSDGSVAVRAQLCRLFMALARRYETRLSESCHQLLWLRAQTTPPGEDPNGQVPGSPAFFGRGPPAAGGGGGALATLPGWSLDQRNDTSRRSSGGGTPAASPAHNPAASPAQPPPVNALPEGRGSFSLGASLGGGGVGGLLGGGASRSLLSQDRGTVTAILEKEDDDLRPLGEEGRRLTSFSQEIVTHGLMVKHAAALEAQLVSTSVASAIAAQVGLASARLDLTTERESEQQQQQQQQQQGELGGALQAAVLCTAGGMLATSCSSSSSPCQRPERRQRDVRRCDEPTERRRLGSAGAAARGGTSKGRGRAPRRRLGGTPGGGWRRA